MQVISVRYVTICVFLAQTLADFFRASLARSWFLTSRERVCVGRGKKEGEENGAEEGAEKGGGDIKTLRVHLDSSSSLSSFSGMTIRTNLPAY